MGQWDIVDFLKKHKGKKFTAVEIANNMDASRNSVTRCLSQLRRHSLIIYTDSSDSFFSPFKTYNKIYYSYKELEVKDGTA